MRLIDADALLEGACNLEAQALAYVGKIVNDESKIEEWKIWSAILAERTAFKHDVFDAPTIEPEDKCCECDAWNKYKNYSQHWISVMDRLPEMDERVLVYTIGHEYHVWDAMPNRGENYAWEDEEGLYHNLYEVDLWSPLPEPYEEQV